MEAATYAVVAALLAGTARALTLWRASIGVEVVNVTVLNALAEGRGGQLHQLLRGSGSAPYLEVAGAIGRALLELRGGGSDQRELRERLRRQATAAVVAANRRLRRHAWLDAVTLAAIVFAGLTAVVNGRAPGAETAGLVAASLLWLWNARAARSIATRIYAGAEALVDSLAAALDEIPEAAPALEALDG